MAWCSGCTERDAKIARLEIDLAYERGSRKAQTRLAESGKRMAATWRPGRNFVPIQIEDFAGHVTLKSGPNSWRFKGWDDPGVAKVFEQCGWERVEE